MFGNLLSRIPTTTASALAGPTGTNTTGSGAEGRSGAALGKRKQRYELQMIAHSSLDTIEDALITSPYL